MTTYHIEAFDFDYTALLDPTIHREDAGVLVADSTAVLDVTETQISSWLRFKTDAEDINDNTNLDDLVFKTNSNAWPVQYYANAFVVAEDGNRALPGNSFNGLDHTVEYDRVRWIARDVFANGDVAGAFGVDLFNNESALRADITNFDTNILDGIKTKIAAADGLLMNNTNANQNIGRAILLHALDNATNRFTNADLLASNARGEDEFYPFTFKAGDSIILKVNYQPKSTGVTITGLNAVTEHSYLYKLNVVAE